MESGFLLVDKPKGWTSHDVVAKLRAVTGVRKVGHGGTLDPLATGLLVIGIGDATKRLDRFVQGDKTYLAEVTLGATSTTDDAEGDLTVSAKRIEPSREAILDTLKCFTGTQDQLPPVYSALKSGGKKAYVEARAGRPVERKPRLVTIRSLDLITYRYPTLTLRTTVSKGTYVRALARDIGEALGTGAYLAGLRRERVGNLSIEEASRLSELEQGWRDRLLPL